MLYNTFKLLVRTLLSAFVKVFSQLQSQEKHKLQSQSFAFSIESVKNSCAVIIYKNK